MNVVRRHVVLRGIILLAAVQAALLLAANPARAGARHASSGAASDSPMLQAPAGANLLEELRVDATQAPYSAESRMVLESGQQYTIEASGTFDYWGNQAQGVDPVWCFAAWRCGEGQDWNAFRIDGKGMKDLVGQTIPYNPQHVYWIPYTGQGKRVSFGINEAHGGMLGLVTVRIYGGGAAPTYAPEPAAQANDPVISSVIPSQVAPGSEGVLKITGSNFAPGATVSLWNPGIQVLDTNVLSSTEITSHVRVAANAAGGPTTLNVTNPDGRVGIADFTVTGNLPPAPATAPGNVPPTVAEGLIAWWRFDEGSGSVANDSAGNGNNGNLVGSPMWVDGQTGKALEFNGVKDYVDTPVDVQPRAMSSTTWTAWVYPMRVNFHERQFILSDNTGDWGRSIFVAADAARFGVFTGDDHPWLVAPADVNQWQFVAVVYTPDNIQFYRNGVAYSWDHRPKGMISRHPLQIGRNPGFGGFYKGRVDDVRIYNRALSEAEIRAIQNGTQ